MRHISRSEKGTYRLAKKFAKTLKGGEVIALNGDLGAGKTTFTKGIGKALGVKASVLSPTFTFMNQYHDGRLKLYHFDMYRIEDESEVQELGLNEFFYSDGVCVVEWAEKIKSQMPEKHITINIEKLGENKRAFEIKR